MELLKLLAATLLVVVLIGGILLTCQTRDQRDLDQRDLDELKKAGSNLSKPHQFKFFLYFPTEASANEAAKDVKVEVDSVKVLLGFDQQHWLGIATKNMVPDHQQLVTLRKRLNEIAGKGDGRYDGWGAEVLQQEHAEQIVGRERRERVSHHNWSAMLE